MSVIKNKAKFINEIASKISPEVSVEAIKRDLNRLNFSTIKSLRYFLDSVVGYKHIEKLEEVINIGDIKCGYKPTLERENFYGTKKGKR